MYAAAAAVTWAGAVWCLPGGIGTAEGTAEATPTAGRARCLSRRRRPTTKGPQPPCVCRTRFLISPDATTTGSRADAAADHVEIVAVAAFAVSLLVLVHTLLLLLLAASIVRSLIVGYHVQSGLLTLDHIFPTGKLVIPRKNNITREIHDSE